MKKRIYFFLGVTLIFQHACLNCLNMKALDMQAKTNLSKKDSSTAEMLNCD